MAVRTPREKTLPTGTVTFLFTDIEGSTRLVQKLDDRYGNLLADHCRIMREAITGAGGTELGTEGDSFFAVFPTAAGGLAATVAAQRALAANAWPDSVEVRVRMGLHTGEGKLGGENYLGLDVHRAARIAGAGHGGQILLSDTTNALGAEGLPTGASIRELGAHRLKDLANPERLYQLVVPGLPSDFRTTWATTRSSPNHCRAWLPSRSPRATPSSAFGSSVPTPPSASGWVAGRRRNGSGSATHWAMRVESSPRTSTSGPGKAAWP